ncbi:MAG: 3-phosphoshikimate 1-carboxyvinyltransferase [Candidatus Rokubacteria bacterium]|nr:3-phosphoshikimate 1-carboxyvinyltransferase [Candidatus Rokubacteria bacterium]
MRLRVRPVARLSGRVRVPGDKSISHRAALLGAVAPGVTEVRGFLEAEDCGRTLTAVQALGAEVTRKGPGEYRIAGAGRMNLQEPGDVIDCGNSGTTARLLLGVLAAQPFTTVLTGDDSLRRRPMARVAEPLAAMGATFLGRSGNARLPLAVRGARPLRAMSYRTPVASAQVKSAVLLAGLWADGAVTVTEPSASRDHSERMLRQFGASVTTSGCSVTIVPGDLAGAAVDVPGDISSAAFFLVAASIVRDAAVSVEAVGVNPTRTGILEALSSMGGRLVEAERRDTGEPMATITLEPAALSATEIGGALVPRLIDELPVLAVAAALARGTTRVRDAAELRVKESDRIGALARELGTMGARITEKPDGFDIDGVSRLQGAAVASGGDHRLAMALAVAGLVAEGETVIDDVACIATSFPTFVETMNALAGREALTVEP